MWSKIMKKTNSTAGDNKHCLELSDVKNYAEIRSFSKQSDPRILFYVQSDLHVITLSNCCFEFCYSQLLKKPQVTLLSNMWTKKYAILFS